MYDKGTMKLTSTLLVLAFSGPATLSASAQTTPAKPPASTATKPATSSTVRRAPVHTAGSCADVPTLAASIPKVTAVKPGCPALYALRYVDTKIGTGPPVTPRKWLTVNYTGYLTDGTKFDSSLGVDKDGKPKEPITFPYGAHQVITGWDTGFEGMLIGGKRRLFIPYQLAYGEMGRPPVIPAKATLVFDVELLGVSDQGPKPPPGAPQQPQRPQTPPPVRPQGTQPAPPTGSQPVPQPPPQPGAQPAPPPGSPTTPAATPPNPSNPATVPPPADPTKPTTVPPSSSTPPASTSSKP
jgi:peptidylprolyl isomerase